MPDIEDVEERFAKEELMTPEGIAQYANALINVQRKERIPMMAELKQQQKYFACDDDEKELIRQIIGGYKFTADACLSELDDCYMQLSIKKSEQGLGYDMSCIFCREKNGRCSWFNIAPADYFLIIQILGNYQPNLIHSFAPYFFFKEEIVDLVDEAVSSQLQVKTLRKKIKTIR